MYFLTTNLRIILVIFGHPSRKWIFWTLYHKIVLLKVFTLSQKYILLQRFQFNVYYYRDFKLMYFCKLCCDLLILFYS